MQIKSTKRVQFKSVWLFVIKQTSESKSFEVHVEIGLEDGFGFANRVEENIPTTAKYSYASVTDGGESTSGIGGSRKKENQNNGQVNDITGDRGDQLEKFLNG